MSRIPMLVSCFASAAVCALAGAPAAHAAPPPNDNLSALQPVDVDGDTASGTTVDATIEADEPLTANRAGGLGCDDRVHSGTTSGAQLVSTIWYGLIGDGRTLTAWTDGSSFDTVLAVYNLTTGDFATCTDDWAYSTVGASEVRFPTVDGDVYAFQLGGCGNCNEATTSGTTALTVISPPANDHQANARRLTTGTPITDGSNLGATEDSGEVLNCDGSPYGKTVWYRVSVPAAGTLTVQAASAAHDSVLAIYPHNGHTPVACNDDGSGAVGPARAKVAVGPGEYDVQVGGYRDPRHSGDNVDADDGSFIVSAEFARSIPNFDLDGDGSAGPPHGADCNDHNAAIHPGAREIPNNDVDENCDGIKAQDADHDGHLAPPAGDDCNDHNPAVHPGAPSVVGNGIAENCVSDPPYGRVPGVPRIFYQIYKHPTRVKVVRLVVQPVEAGSTVTLTCSGRGCPARHRFVVHVKRHKAKLAFHIKFKRKLKVKARITLSITHPNEIGAVRQITVRRRSVSDRSLCQWPNERKPRSCV
jgi:hypothetical protein